MSFKLHLMNDRKVIATEEVSRGFSSAFKNLMDSIIVDLDTDYVSERCDTDLLAVNIMKTEALHAKANPPAKEDIPYFHTGDPASYTGYYSVVVHATRD